MTIKRVDRIVREHPFFDGLSEPMRALVAGCAGNIQFDTGDWLFREGAPADHVYLLRQGRVALEMAAPGRGAVTFQTLSAGEVVGVSWLIPPYSWSYDARAVEPVRAIALDAACLRRKCDEDHDFGYAMMLRFVPLLVERLQTTRLQILDVYGNG